MKMCLNRICSIILAMFYGIWFAPMAQAYAFNMIVPDVRQPSAISGGSACPVKARQLISAGSIAIQWSTALNLNPVTIVTQNQTASGRLTEIEQVITQSMAVWAAVSGTTLVPASFAPLVRTATQNACGSDGVNTICFDQADMAFTPGVVAFTRVIEADRIGMQVGSSAVATQLGQILDADVYFNPSSAQTTYATPQALATTPAAYDLESVLTHELGHLLGFSHSAIWGAIMFPFAPAPGTFSGTRPTTQTPDASLGDDDRTGLRVLYPNAADTVHQGSISGKILPVNPLALPASPPGVTGVFASGSRAQLHCLCGGAQRRSRSIAVHQCDRSALSERGQRSGVAVSARLCRARCGHQLHGSDAARTLKGVSSFKFPFSIFHFGEV